jgi:hypothetical protein
MAIFSVFETEISITASVNVDISVMCHRSGIFINPKGKYIYCRSKYVITIFVVLVFRV